MDSQKGWDSPTPLKAIAPGEWTPFEDDVDDVSTSKLCVLTSGCTAQDVCRRGSTQEEEVVDSREDEQRLLVVLVEELLGVRLVGAVQVVHALRAKLDSPLQ